MSSTTHHRPAIERPDADTTFWLTTLAACGSLGVVLGALAVYLAGAVL